MKKLGRSLWNSKPRFIWIVLLGLIIFDFSYNAMFSWNESFAEAPHEVQVKPDEVAFVTIEEKPITLKRSSFQSLQESLTSWKFDEENKTVYLKFRGLFSDQDADGNVHLGKDTKSMVIYKQGIDAFESRSEVLPIPSFPYQYKFQNEPLFKMYHVEKDGTVLLDFRGKKIKLPPGKNYYGKYIEGYQPKIVVIKNHGLYSKNQFKLMEDTDKKDKKATK